ncbi:hypothetical protein F7725_020052 [Dissostichus mawsoni]|uniref:Lactoylglutathione lyase n=1 Tax=Dissostichus mawsoni TaxID=36200 RepID=A0A7J5YMF4_DISMA|nr:hypothetical protein F7725_020052 [Dissostichus mawsoni]
MASQGGMSEEAVSAACKEGDPITRDFMMQQTMLRVKDPGQISGFLHASPRDDKIDPSMRFTLYFLGFEEKSDIPEEIKERTAWTNWGSELEESLSFHNGNRKPTGFGHIGIAVPDVYAACKWKMKDLAFIQDPDGYWIEILSPNNMFNLTQKQQQT